MSKNIQDLYEALKGATFNIVAGNEEGFDFGDQTSKNDYEDVFDGFAEEGNRDAVLKAGLEAFSFDGLDYRGISDLMSQYDQALASKPENVIAGALSDNGSGKFIAGNEEFGADVVGAYKEIQVAVNASIASNETFVEKIYPTISGSMTSGGYRFIHTAPIVQNQYTRDAAGNLHDDTIGDSIVKMVRYSTGNPFAINGIKLVPYPGDENDTYLLREATFVDTETNKSTAPIKTNIDTIDFGALCFDTSANVSERPSYLTNFDGNIKTQWVYYRLTDGDGNTSLHRVLTELNGNSKWQTTDVGSVKDMQLNMNNMRILIDADRIKDINGETSDVITNLDIPGYKIYLRYSVSGSLNTMTMQFQTLSTRFTLDKVIDADGNEVTAGDAKYDAIADVIANVETKIEATYQKAIKTNENLETFGIEVNTRTESEILEVGYKTAVYVNTSLFSSDPKTALSIIDSSVNVEVITNAIAALTTKFAQWRNLQEQGDTEAFKDAVAITAKRVVDPHIGFREIDLYNQVDAQETTTTIKNIGALIANNIKQMMNTLEEESGFISAHKILGIGQKPTLTIVTDEKIKTALDLDGSVFKNDYYNVEVVGHNHELLKNKVRVIPTVKPSGNTMTVLTNTLRVVVPTPVIDVRGNFGNNSTVKRTVVQPAFDFHNRLPIGIELDVIGFDKVVSNKNLYVVQQQVQ